MLDGLYPHVDEDRTTSFQLQSSLTTLNGRDTIITAGTGSGKTLVCLLIPHLLWPKSISIMISPLKHLQAMAATPVISSLMREFTCTRDGWV